jgi:predicted O-linked N-acetylglucosamine transferase (SPINDLY family)
MSSVAYLRRLFQRGVDLHARGSLAEAERVYRQLLAEVPQNAEVLQLLGTLCAQQGRNTEALDLLARAIAHNAASAPPFVVLANVLAAEGRIAEALTSYDRAIRIDPRCVEAHDGKGTALYVQRRFEEALASYDAAVALRSQFAEGFNNRGYALQQLKRYPEAIASCEQALAINPRFADALNNRGNNLHLMGCFEDALASYDAALAIQPGYADAFYNRGNTLLALRRLDDALASHEQALRLQPGFAAALNGRGNVLHHLGRLDEAIASYDAALTVQPDLVDALNNRGRTWQALQSHRKALDSYETALSLAPGNSAAFNGAALVALHLCDWALCAGFAQTMMRRVAAGAFVPPLVLLAYGGDEQLQLQAAKTATAEMVPGKPERMARHGRRDGEKIRLGYLSSDFGEHPVGAQIVELLERHDRSRFEVFGFSTGADDGGPLRARIARACDQFHDLGPLSDTAAAERIADQKIDILIDLNGHTEGARFGILARRPAPVQASWLGYAGTSGADFIDAVIADAHVAPPESEAAFSENIIRLPDSYFVSDRQRPIGRSPSRSEEGLPENAFVFCCFNASWKINATMFEVWMRILAQTPGSVLWLRAADEASANMRHAARAHGIDPSRLIFAHKAELPVHLARHALADLFLDTLPFNAHATACDALWAGLPVLTCQGKSFCGRVGASLLRAAGLPELIADDMAAYEALALSLARAPEKLGAIRAALQSGQPALFDTDLFRRNFETALIQISPPAQR